MKPAKLPHLEVTIEKLIPGGYGLAHTPEGKACLIRGGLPGDRVRFEIWENHKTYVLGLVKKVVQEGTPRGVGCPAFPQCGGCDFPHLPLAYQQEWKKRWVMEKLKPSVPLTFFPSFSHYRLRSCLHRGKGGWGFHAWRSQGVVGLKTCFILSQTLLERLPKLSEKGKHMWCLEDPPGENLITSLEKPTPTLTFSLKKLTWATDPQVFIQSNRYLLPAFIQIVEETFEETLDLFLDGYAGMGFLTLPLAHRAKKGYAVEASSRAYTYLKKNLQPYPHLQAIFASMETFIAKENLKPQGVILDPPREGLSPPIIAWLKETLPRKVLYFSCHLAVFFRDLARLSPPYTLRQVYLLDLFPHTHHLEIAGVLTP